MTICLNVPVRGRWDPRGLINNIGPRIEPCGTPTCIGKIVDVVSSISVRSLYKFKRLYFNILLSKYVE